METPDEEDLEDLYNWVDEISLSRSKKNIARDFADGVLVAEMCKHFTPKLVELHNYNPYENKAKRKENWDILNRRVFKKLHFELADDVINKVINSEPFAIEKVLMLLRRKIDRHLFEIKRKKPQDGCVAATGSKNQAGHVSDRPEADQNLAHHDNKYKGDMVPKVVVEEKEQEILAKEETIQILTAKIRRLEHLVHLKDIRIDDLNVMLEEMGGTNKTVAGTTKMPPIRR